MPSCLSGGRPRSRGTGLAVLELVLHQYERIRGHVGVKQCAVPVISFAAVENQPIGHRGKRFAGAREKLCEQDLRANVALVGIGALAPRNHLGPGELIVEEISLVLVSVGHDRRVSNEVFHFRQDRWEPWSVPEIGWLNPVDLDGLGVDRAIRVDLGAPRLALLPALAFTQHFDETDFDDDARGSPGERLLANEFGVRGTLASRLRVEGDEPVETVEESRHVHRGPPKQPQFLCVSLIDVTREEDRRLSAARRTAALTRQRPCYVLGGHGYFLATRQDPPVRPEGIGLRRLSRRRAGRRLGSAQVTPQAAAAPPP